MRYTLLLTQRCNLACTYCYIGQQTGRMPLRVAREVVDFAYAHTPPSEDINVGFFGGEPLLEFERLCEITELFEAHPSFDRERVQLTVVTNGTIFTPAIAEFVAAHDLHFGISCDGPPEIQDASRVFHGGRDSSPLVERTIRDALEAFSHVMVNSVYAPGTLADLPRTVAYLSDLGVRQIHLNPDFTAPWTPEDAARLPLVFEQIGDLYVDYYLRGDPHFISLIDSKISVILRGGYQALERCRMGRGEFAFAPDGGIYPCERLVGDGSNGHRIGNIDTGLRLTPMACHEAAGGSDNRECTECGLAKYCMNWCGCSNFFSSGYYNRVSPFLCASERASINTAYAAFRALESRVGHGFCDHMGGAPHANSFLI